MKVTVQLVVWNGEQHLPALFASLSTQTCTDWELVVLDNGSTDRSLMIIETAVKKMQQPFRVISKKENTGFAAPHQELFSQTSSDYVFVLNQDIILEPNTLAQLVQFADEHKQVASVAPTLVRLEKGQKTNIIDSLGFSIKRNRQVTERMGGERINNNQTESATFVFGVSAAAALYRRSAVTQAGGLFEPLFFAYKEDVDLAWRLQLIGFAAAVLNQVMAYHDRTGRPPETTAAGATIANKQRQSSLLRYHSYKNQLVMIKTCDQWQNTLLDFPWILWYELRKFIYLMLFDWHTLSGLGELWRQRKMIRARRQKIQQTATVSWQHMRQWWS